LAYITPQQIKITTLECHNSPQYISITIQLTRANPSNEALIDNKKDGLGR